MAAPTRLVQLDHPGFGRRVALVDGADLHLLGTYRSIYQFAQVTLETGHRLRDILSTDLTGIALDYGPVWSLETEWRFLPSFDHPHETGRCLVSGAGLTHAATGSDRGPALFYKGSGLVLCAHGDPLAVPEFAAGGAEEAEVAAVYVVDRAGVPRRVGLTPGNEFCDPAQAEAHPAAHAHSKLRPCSIGPELWLDAAFEEISGAVSVRRGSEPLWSAELLTGNRHTRYPLEEIEASLFRHAGHRRPGDVHIHFLGSPATSYACGVRLQPGDEMMVAWEGFGRPLVNRFQRAAALSPASALPL
jgi:hypothetical protein